MTLLQNYASEAGLSKPPRKPQSSASKEPARSAIDMKAPRIMDFRPSQSLAAGLKRVGGRKSSVSRLGNFARRGRPVTEHKF